MSKKHCTVCGLNEKACLHSQKLKHDSRDLRVTRIFWFTMGFLSAIPLYLFSCSTQIITNYKITDTAKRNYYTNSYEIRNDSIHFTENGHHNQILRTFSLPFAGILIQEK
jgi:predicted nucleic acid-binding Zn ribbon protein